MDVNAIITSNSAHRVDEMLLTVVVVFVLDALCEVVYEDVMQSKLFCTVANKRDHLSPDSRSSLVVDP